MFLIFNGSFLAEDEPMIRADNRGFRYGDGVFETMFVSDGRVRLGAYHLDRLAAGMQQLKLVLSPSFCLETLESQLAALCARNGVYGECRARLTVFRSSSGWYLVPDDRASYILQVSELVKKSTLSGLSIGVFPDGRKACDALSSLKSNNYLLSSLAGRYGKEHNWDECLILNSFGRVAETAAANLWWVRNGRIHTPPLSEGCVSGIMRRFLLEALPAAGYTVSQSPIGSDELKDADELFLSNAIRGIQAVGLFAGRRYNQQAGAAILAEIVNKI